MAKPYQKKGLWYARVKDATGAWRGKKLPARTRAEAKRLATELEHRYHQERLGIVPSMAVNGGGTVAELMQWWLPTYAIYRRGYANDKSFVEKHICKSEIAGLPIVALKPSHVHTFLHEKHCHLKPRSINHLRGYLSRAFNAALKAGRYHGVNPATKVDKIRVPRRAHDYLRAHEVGSVLAHTPSKWRPLLATAIYTGLALRRVTGTS